MKKNKAHINCQHHPHYGGAQNNAAPGGQPNAHNVAHHHRGVMQDSEEQVRDHKNLPGTERNTSNRRKERSGE